MVPPARWRAPGGHEGARRLSRARTRASRSGQSGAADRLRGVAALRARERPCAAARRASHSARPERVAPAARCRSPAPAEPAGRAGPGRGRGGAWRAGREPPGKREGPAEVGVALGPAACAPWRPRPVRAGLVPTPPASCGCWGARRRGQPLAEPGAARKRAVLTAGSDGSGPVSRGGGTGTPPWGLGLGVKSGVPVIRGLFPTPVDRVAGVGVVCVSLWGP